MQESDDIDIADDISSRLENLHCFSMSLRDHCLQEMPSRKFVGQLGILQAEIERLQGLSEELSHTLLQRKDQFHSNEQVSKPKSMPIGRLK